MLRGSRKQKVFWGAYTHKHSTKELEGSVEGFAGSRSLKTCIPLGSASSRSWV